MQNFTPVPLTVFEILGFKLKNKNNDKRTKVQNPRRSFVEHIAQYIAHVEPGGCTCMHEVKKVGG